MVNSPYSPVLRYMFLKHGPTFLTDGEQFNATIGAKAKRARKDTHEVANELIGLQLGRLLGLPIPDGVVVEDENEWLFASLNVSPEDLPPVTDDGIQQILANNFLATGIIYFDAWIVNGDRSRRNISYLHETKEIVVFDHGNALWLGDGRSLLKSRDSLGIGQHCLKGIDSLDRLPEWHKRASDIPEWMIKDAVFSGVGHGLDPNEAEQLLAFLLERRTLLPGIFNASTASFPRLNNKLFSLIPTDSNPVPQAEGGDSCTQST